MESGEAAEACRSVERYLDDPERGANAGLLVCLLARTGQRARAAALLARLAADGFEGVVLEDTFSLAALCLGADGTTDLSEAEAAEQLYRKLSPYARHFGMSGTGNSCLAPFLASWGGVLAGRDVEGRLVGKFLCCVR